VLTSLDIAVTLTRTLTTDAFATSGHMPSPAKKTYQDSMVPMTQQEEVQGQGKVGGR